MKKDRVASLTQELASLQDDEELGGQVAQLVAALNTRSARKPLDKASTRYEAAQATCRTVPVVEIPSSRPAPGPATRVIPTIREIDPHKPEPAQLTSTPAVPGHPYTSAKDGIH